MNAIGNPSLENLLALNGLDDYFDNFSKAPVGSNGGDGNTG